MWARCSAALALLLTSAAEASSPSDSDVVWRDADWPGELGSLPFGNGLSTGQAWVEQTSGDLLMYLGRVDAFDVNAQPVHVGRVRLSFAPPPATPATTLCGVSARYGSPAISMSAWYSPATHARAQLPATSRAFPAPCRTRAGQGGGP